MMINQRKTFNCGQVRSWIAGRISQNFSYWASFRPNDDNFRAREGRGQGVYDQF